nr:vesicle-associated protein 2-2-like protein [Reaumuria trigyna]
MSSQLLEIQPHRELKFNFELKKQSSCKVRLVNKTDHHVAFKVKTTSPKKYCVRPNVGLVLPKEVSEFVVTMQAQKSAPPDMICKDKFLIQSTVVPVGTMEEDVTSNMFSKEDGRYIEENKLKVTLVAPSPSHDLSPLNGKLNGSTYEDSVDKSQLSNIIGEPAPNHVVTKHMEESVAEGIEEVKPVEQVQYEHPKDVEPEPIEVVQSNIVKETELKPTKNMETVKVPEEAKTVQDMSDQQLTEDAEVVSMSSLETKPRKDIGSKIVNNGEELRLIKDVEEMKSKLHELESKLNKAERTIVALREERKSTIQESDILQQQLAHLKTKKMEKKVQVGFPFLFVCMVGLVCAIFGYSMHR